MSKYNEDYQMELYSNQQTRITLKQMLKELIPYIVGEWFIGKGALLGIVRDGDLILEDHDIDLFLLPGSYINLPNDWGIQNYYLDTKLFKKTGKPNNINMWYEYCRYTTCKFPYLKNRAEVFHIAKQDYKENRIIPIFTTPFFDIYNLVKRNNRYEVPYWIDISNSYFTNEEVENIQKNYVLGFEINIPAFPENILQRHFGIDWTIPIKNYRKQCYNLENKI